MARHVQEPTEHTLVNPPVSRSSTVKSKSQYVPPDHASRTLVLCFDGTGDQFDADNSNVVQFCSMLRKDDPSKQMVYYQTGIGTYTTPQFTAPLMTKLSQVLDAMVAWNLHAHVMDGYQFLMENYVAGDRICLFGFSRGAYTARSLAGMLHKVGLLPAGNLQQIPFAYKMYTKTGTAGWKQSNAFKRAFSVDVDIEFVGVWDTVDSVGVIPRRLPFTTSNTIIRHFRHAVSLDERRALFQANLWNRPSADEQKLGIEAKKPKRRSKLFFMQQGGDGNEGEEDKEDEAEDKNEALYGAAGKEQTDVDEVWFAGCHCDIGGGSISNGTPHKLSRIPLRWMIRECFKTKSGIMFDRDGLEELGLDPDTITQPRPEALPPHGVFLERKPRRWPRLPWAAPAPPATNVFTRVDARGARHADVHGADGALVVGTEEEEELRDALAPRYDRLRAQRAWWALEVLPTRRRFQRADDSWGWAFGPHLGAPRAVPPGRVRVHRSVRTRGGAAYADGKRGRAARALAGVEGAAICWVD